MVDNKENNNNQSSTDNDKNKSLLERRFAFSPTNRKKNIATIKEETTKFKKLSEIISEYVIEISSLLVFSETFYTCYKALHAQRHLLYSTIIPIGTVLLITVLTLTIRLKVIFISFIVYITKKCFYKFYQKITNFLSRQSNILLMIMSFITYLILALLFLYYAFPTTDIIATTLIKALSSTK